jgi:hypothetical protein
MQRPQSSESIYEDAVNSMQRDSSQTTLYRRSDIEHVETGASPQSAHQQQNIKQRAQHCAIVCREKARVCGHNTKKFWYRRTRWEQCGIVSTILFVLLVIIVVPILASLWHDMPGFTILGAISDETTKQGIQLDIGDGVSRPPSINISLKLNVSVENPNGFSFFFPVVDVDAFQRFLPEVILGSTVVRDLYLEPYKNTIIQVPINITYDFKNDKNNIIPQEILEACTVRPGATVKDRDLYISVNLKPTLKFLNLFNIRINTIRRDNTVVCPFDMNRIIDFAGYRIDLGKVKWEYIAQMKPMDAISGAVVKL